VSGLRVLHVIEAMQQGGAESLILEHVRHAGPDVTPLVCALNRGGPAFDAARRLGAGTFMLAKGGSHGSGVARLVRLIRAERVTVVNGHNPTGGLYAAVAGSLAGVPLIVRTEHSIHYRGRHSRLYTGVIEPSVTAVTGRVICVCEAVRVSHARRLAWAAARFVTVQNGVSDAPHVRPREALRSQFGFAPGERVALTVGSLTRQKAQHVLIDAFARVAGAVPGARLVLVGEGPLRGMLEERARRSGFGDRIRFLGSRDDASALIEAADVFVLSSEREGLPVTLLEAMCAGRPAVATDVGGNREAVAHGETGLVVPPHDPESLGEAMRALLSDPGRAGTLGVAARARWASRFTAERMVADTETVYRSALQRRDPARSDERPRKEEQHASA
jgi:glycosyltransferase involved in cell wall biosynthesis